MMTALAQQQPERGISMNDARVLTWASAKEAFVWASEYASRPDCRDSVGQLLTKPGSFCRQDLVDQALTITGLAHAMEHPLNVLYRLVYGDSDIDIDGLTVADYVAHVMHRQHEGKPIGQLRGLAGGILREMRRVELYGCTLRVSAIASASDIPRQRLYEPATWGLTYIDTRTALQDMLEIGERRLAQELEERGWLSGCGI